MLRNSHSPALGALLLLTLCLATAAAGCGNRRRTYPVVGKVVFRDGTPLNGGLVEFESLSEGEKPINAHGAIHADGSFQLGTYSDGDGAVEGLHRAIVRPPFVEASNLNEGVLPRPIIHHRFENYEASGLRYTVVPGSNQFTIIVEKP